ncbi:DUF2189 domain-containing protein [Roseateles amylovorans]|uniref:DUF2189 domain-containing protein n=1 Tax=Roseateles amylovorans TaxID=2978473 RepID=A0ABY6B7M1_9BURK|nr:DUF2189 domain-containing protein [Roseateles amylovorans]UXH80460.1 DUF2189 domain-containing protein [Roseateles amylovorans]
METPSVEPPVERPVVRPNPEPPAGPPAASPAAPPGSDPEAPRPWLPPLRPLRMADPWRWLAAGWRDFRRAPGIGLVFGTLFAVMGWALVGALRAAPAYVLALSAGFLLLGPFLALGLYKVSRDLERSETPDLGDALTCWSDHIGQMALFGGALLLLEMVWARASLVIFAVSFDSPPEIHSLRDLLAPDYLPFLTAYVAVGAIFATLIFAFSVIALPMMLDREVDAITAALTSAQLVWTQTGVMALWALLIAALVGLAMVPGFAGLLIVGPWIGHASWHAYRSAVGDLRTSDSG